MVMSMHKENLILKLKKKRRELWDVRRGDDSDLRYSKKSSVIHDGRTIHNYDLDIYDDKISPIHRKIYERGRDNKIGLESDIITALESKKKGDSEVYHANRRNIINTLKQSKNKKVARKATINGVKNNVEEILSRAKDNFSEAKNLIKNNSKTAAGLAGFAGAAAFGYGAKKAYDKYKKSKEEKENKEDK